MRRAAIQVLRTARRSHVHRALTARNFSINVPRHISASPARYAWTRLPPHQGQQLSTLQSTVIPRNLLFAILTSLGIGTSWLAYQGGFGSEGGLQTQTQSGQGPIHPGPFVGSVPKVELDRPSVPTAAVGGQAAEEVTDSARRALVVENDQFFTGELGPDQPVSKTVDSSGRMVLEMLTPEQATQKLRQNEASYNVGRGNGVVRYDVVQLPSNNPIEDDHIEKTIEYSTNAGSVPEGAVNSDWMFWGVFDGHSGWTTSAKLRQVLVSFVARELNNTYKSASVNPSSTLPTPEAIDNAIKQGFVKLDNEICFESVEKVAKAGSKRLAAELLGPALSGACALLSFYDTRTQLLRVACTGDSRAVLGRRGAAGKWVATPLSEDQTGGTPSEIARIAAEHPNEPYATRNGRILGQLEPSRAFGDAIYKWSGETAARMKKSFFGRTPSPYLKTPPYVTAEPIVTTTKIEPEKGDFVVMATDGLWECLTNEEVIGLVGQWLDKQRNTNSNGGGIGGWFGWTKEGLPVENHSSASSSGRGDKKGDGQRPPIRQDQWAVEGGDERFVVEDKNVATHLIRNALGGKNKDMVCALLTLPSPYSRRYRDDLTVQVIFFGEGAASGGISQNMEATASAAAGLKPKL